MCQEKSSFTDIQTENMMFKCEIGILLPKQYEIGNTPHLHKVQKYYNLSSIIVFLSLIYHVQTLNISFLIDQAAHPQQSQRYYPHDTYVAPVHLIDWQPWYPVKGGELVVDFAEVQKAAEVVSDKACDEIEPG